MSADVAFMTERSAVPWRVLMGLLIATTAGCGGGTADGDSVAENGAAPVVAPLSIVGSEPGEGATSVPVDVAVSLTYSERLAEAPSLVLVGSNGKPVGGAVTLSGSTATFTPYVPLAHFNDYTLRAEGGTGASGAVPDPKPAALRIGFRTAASTTQPAIAWGAPPLLTFSAEVGGPRPSGQSVTVLNAGGGALDGLAVAGVQYGKGASDWVQSVRLDANVAPATLMVDVDPAGLARGRYFASVAVFAPRATNIAQSLVVTLEVR